MFWRVPTQDDTQRGDKLCVIYDGKLSIFIGEHACGGYFRFCSAKMCRRRGDKRGGTPKIGKNGKAQPARLES